MKIFHSFLPFQLIWIYLVASRSPFRVKFYSFMYMHKISTQMNFVNGTMVIFLFMVNNVGTSLDSQGKPQVIFNPVECWRFTSEQQQQQQHLYFLH